MRVFIDPVHGARPIILFGAGHVAAALCPLLVEAGYAVTVYDPRPERLDLPEFSRAAKIHADFTEAAQHVQFHPDLHILAMTPQHRYDFDVAIAVVDKPWRFLGVMGSNRKKKQLLDKLKESGASEENVARIRIPVGMDIGSETPFEIAVSILAELIRLHARPEKIWAK